MLEPNFRVKICIRREASVLSLTCGLWAGSNGDEIIADILTELAGLLQVLGSLLLLGKQSMVRHQVDL